MDFFNRRNYLQNLYRSEEAVELKENGVKIIPFPFIEKREKKEISSQNGLVPEGTLFCSDPDIRIQENKEFAYSVFTPGGNGKYRNCIILLHGLNERNWSKYLAWAEYLSITTGKPVILFPIAFHMNRTPQQWASPRWNMSWVNQRKADEPDSSNSTFANVALSYRLSSSPLRLYTSGRETIQNLRQLIRQITGGRHPLFMKNTSVDFFAYSIGAMIAQVFMLGDPDKLLSDSRFFLFCGGSVFEEMNGSAREIMDQAAWEKVKGFYADRFMQNEGLNETLIPGLLDESLNKAFTCMLKKDFLSDYRMQFFKEERERLRIMTLKKDTVIPTRGAYEAIGMHQSHGVITELDFPFEYSHQAPFPTGNSIDPGLINDAFMQVFRPAAEFLA